MNGDGLPGLAEYFRVQRSRVDAALDKYLPSASECPETIAGAMRYSVFAGGKRLRPILALAAAESTAVHSTSPGERSPEAGVELALPAACALEMIHTYSLIHDDLPAMDNDTLRRGRPTLHVVHGEAIAILAGDGLLTEAFRVLATEPQTDDPEIVSRKLRTAAVVARAAGVAGMVGGQVMDLQATGQHAPAAGPMSRTVAVLDALHAAKTGALIRAATVAGAIMAGAPQAIVDVVDSFAADLGLAFQVVDDLLDVESSSDELGKTAGKDQAAGKLTYPAVFGIEESWKRARDLVRSAEEKLEASGLGGTRLVDIARWVTRRSN